MAAFFKSFNKGTQCATEFISRRSPVLGLNGMVATSQVKTFMDFLAFTSSFSPLHLKLVSVF